MIVDVLVEVQVKGLNQTFSYLIPNEFEQENLVGRRVLVPFGNRKIEGFIVGINNKSEIDYAIKPVDCIIDKEPVLNKEMLDLGKYISQKTLSSLISVYQTMLPSALKAKNKKIKVREKYETYIYLLKDDYVPKTETQAKIILLLKKGGVLKKTLQDISLSSLNTLKKNNVVFEKQVETYRLDNNDSVKEGKKVLNEEQKKAFDHIIEKTNCFHMFLLYGVTGSGKTEVYMQVIDEVLKNNKEVVVLVPEISLTPQFVETFKARFGSLIAILHSGLSDGEKYDEWRKIERQEVKIVIGARSAIFAPFTNIGLIIVDEEHSDTYRQENNPKYDAIDVAIKRCKTHNCPLVLGSATPSLESYTRAKMGIYDLLTIKKRIHNKMPEVKLVDMRYDASKENKVLSKTLIQAMTDCLNKGEQIIILLNRRGYSTVVSCHECGYTVKCPNCEIPLTYHKMGNKMVCHYCNYVTYKPINCPNCHSDNINSYGIGTQQLQEIIDKTFPFAKTVRMDIDTTRRKGSHFKIFNDFKDGKYDILIGTQMVAKGLDFPRVTLVGVVNGDASLNMPDFRSAERTYSLLSQVAGRSGRGNLSGKVIIQGFNINHYSIISASMHDYDAFYNQEIIIRKKLHYPPYCNLMLLTLSGKDYQEVYNQALKIKKYLEDTKLKIVVLGPSSARIAKQNNKYYIQIIVKYKDTKQLLEKVMYLRNSFNTNKKIGLDIEFNPKRI